MLEIGMAADPSDDDTDDARNGASRAGRRRGDSDGRAADRSKDDDDDDDDGDDDEDDGEKKKKGLLQRPILLIVGGAVALILIVGGLLFWLHARHFESTDDAFIDTHIVRLAPQIEGRVTQVLVNDNQLVGVGQPLVRIDSSDVRTRVAQAQAQKAQAQAQVDNAKVQISANEASYQQSLADAASAEAQAENAPRDLVRYRTLQRLNAQAVSQQQVDQAVTQARQSAAQRDAALKAAKARLDQIIAAKTQVTSGEDQVRAAEAQLDEANINYGYANIVSPVTGHIAQKTVAVGNYVQPGAQLMAIVPLQIWVTANFKETQLASMRVGQPVTFHVDACPADKIEGHVDSIQRGAGQAFGILPPENATGNFVKVVQRVPVKLVFDHPPAHCPLGPGMSVEPSVRVR